MLKKLVKIANRLDDFGLTKEADVIDAVIQKMAQQTRVLPTDEEISELPDSKEDMTTYMSQKLKPPTTGTQPSQGAQSKPAPSATTPATGSGTITPSEIRDAEIRKKLFEAPGSGYKNPAELKEQYNFSFEPTIGRSGNIAKIQASLNSCGFNAGQADGLWGKNTENALLDAIHAFITLPGGAMERAGSLEPAAFDTMLNVAAKIMQGQKPSIPFTLDMITDMCEQLKNAKSSGVRVSGGRPITNYIGSMGGGRYVQKSTPPAEAAVVSTKAGESVAGTYPVR